jgi:hypothetical protein
MKKMNNREKILWFSYASHSLHFKRAYKQLLNNFKVTGKVS